MDYCIATLKNIGHAFPYTLAPQKGINKLEAYKRKHRKLVLTCSNFEPLNYKDVIEKLCIKDIKSASVTFSYNKELNRGYIATVGQECFNKERGL